ncbi:MAG: carboxylase, partial [Deltaproteobacteria bacterium]|nr:carboxylase [Deltaproteobacteria bacterium]
LLFGLYGKTPAAVDPKVREIALRGYDQGVWITDRPANHLKPEMEAARRKLGELARTEEDVLTCVLYPASGEQFLKKKYGRE